MKSIHRSMSTTLFALATFVLGGGAGADDDEPPALLTLYPASETRPALRYQLLPDFRERISGNAAVYYGKVTIEHQRFFRDQQWLDKIEQWRGAPLEQLRADDVRLAPGTVEYWLDRAARCSDCDWQLPFHEEEFYAILLPELSQLRQFGRILGTKARIHIARGQFDDAMKTLRIGYTVGQHAAAGECFVNGLVGITICSIMSDQMLAFVQQPDAPNLYWALTMLPRPLIDVRDAVEAEMHAVELSFPELRDVNNAKVSPAEWNERLHEFCRKLASWSDDSNLKSRALVTAASIRGYPIAKRALIERGMTPETVESMPVGHVVLTYTMQTYSELRDSMFKWFFVPYPEAHERMKAAVQEYSRAARQGREVLPVADVFLPGIQSFRTAVVRNDREIAVLRVIEALRMYAANTGGRLPERLTDVTWVPVPVDPVTSEPFIYRLDGDTATLEGPRLPGAPLNYVIKIAGSTP